MKFSELDLDPNLLDGIESLGFEEMTPIQEEAIPIVLKGKDLIACAQTGTGKTGAYVIPTIDNLTFDESENTRALIIAPTRELAQQIDQNIEALSYFTGISSVPIYGGKDADSFDKQKYAITNGADVLVATPGRFLMHLALGYMDLDHVETLILDEADKMLDMGFHADILKIVSYLPENRQTLMFSATMPKKIRKLAKEIMFEPEEISLNLAKPAEGINQMAFMVYDEQKIPLLEHLLKTREVDSMIIFASSKMSVDNISRKLKRLKYEVEAIHSDKDQSERTATLRKFKNKEFRILVGTDVLARGIDIDNLSHVVNFDAPPDAEDYVHRVGRTARASSTGEAMTFVNPKDMYRFAQIEELIEAEIPQPDIPDELGERPVYRKGRGPRGPRGPRGRHGGHGGGRNRSGGGRGRQGGGYGRGRNNGPSDRQGGSEGGNKRRRNRPSRKNFKSQDSSQGRVPNPGKKAHNEGSSHSNSQNSESQDGNGPKKKRRHRSRRKKKPENGPQGNGQPVVKREE
ncbi:MAG: DEAD/DEAH box helicase [Bacteroidia bacterium]|nr:DEAD/DEAH box helicase [Bacteroidia bacterium]